MKITIEHYGIKLTAELADGPDVDDIHNALFGLLCGIGYHEVTANRILSMGEV